MDYSVLIDRESNLLQLIFDYYIEPYYDPETGEAFSETSWTVNVGSGGTGEWGAPEQNSVPLEFSFSSGTSLSQIPISFFAQNTFSGASDSLALNLFEAGYSTSALSAVGTSIIDVIISGSGDDILAGRDGDDIIDAGGGNDTLSGGAGSDFLDGGAGDDIMIGDGGNDTFRVDSAEDLIVERVGGGIDRVEATISYSLAAEVEQLYLLGTAQLSGIGNSGNNTISGNGAANLLRGMDGDDQLSGNAGNDHLEGGLGNDTLDGGAGKDLMEGGTGNDTYFVDANADQVMEVAGSAGGMDRVFTGLRSYTLGDHVEELWLTALLGSRGTGNGLANTITGTISGDTLLGLAGSDLLDGQNGNDTLIGGAGADVLRGGAGIDWASYETATSAIRVNLLLNAGLSGEANGDTLTEIENLRGGSGNDTLVGDDSTNWIDGGAGDDILRGGLGNDVLFGGIGADRLYGDDGRDTVSYERAVAAVHIDLTSQAVSGGEAQGDTISSFENAKGGLGNDILIGSSVANALSGNDGNDVIDAGGGNDTVNGGRGADTLSGGAGIDILSYSLADGSVSIDLAAGMGAGSDAEGDTFAGFEGVTGGAYNDVLAGDQNANTLNGGAGDDTIAGGEGNDTIMGGSGRDSLTGGAGIDTLSYGDSTSWVSVSLAEGYSYEGAAGIRDVFSGFENLSGGAFNDALYGDSNNNVIRGGAGGDYMVGGGGVDTMYGQGGDDLFVFLTGSGTVTVRDFVAGGTEDRLYLELGSNFDTAAEALAVATTTAAGNTIFRFSATETLILTGVDKASLTTADFHFYTDEFLV